MRGVPDCLRWWSVGLLLTLRSWVQAASWGKRSLKNKILKPNNNIMRETQKYGYYKHLLCDWMTATVTRSRWGKGFVWKAARVLGRTSADLLCRLSVKVPHSSEPPFSSKAGNTTTCFKKHLRLGRHKGKHLGECQHRAPVRYLVAVTIHKLINGYSCDRHAK